MTPGEKTEFESLMEMGEQTLYAEVYQYESGCLLYTSPSPRD